MSSIGTKDRQTVRSGGHRAQIPGIAGVSVHELGNILTRSGFMMELFRADWPSINVTVRQINWVQLNPGGVTDWHCHSGQTDHLIGVGGNIKLALFDGRDQSRSKGATEVLRIGALRPVMVIVPPGVWHGLRNESGIVAGYINIVDELFVYEDPDTWRLSPRSADIPDIL